MPLNVQHSFLYGFWWCRYQPRLKLLYTFIFLKLLYNWRLRGYRFFSIIFVRWIGYWFTKSWGKIKALHLRNLLRIRLLRLQESFRRRWNLNFDFVWWFWKKDYWIYQHYLYYVVWWNRWNQSLWLLVHWFLYWKWTKWFRPILLFLLYHPYSKFKVWSNLRISISNLSCLYF